MAAQRIKGFSFENTFTLARGNSLGSLTIPEAGQLYFNVHSAAQPAGEIRGQLSVISDERLANGPLILEGSLSADQEVPPNDSDATGDGRVVISKINSGKISVEVSLDVTGLDVVPATLMHIHQAAAGSNGGVVLNLDPDGALQSDAPAALKAAGFVKTSDWRGTNQDDRIVGNGVIDTMDGRDGADTLKGKGGDDVLSGGAGRDTVDGGSGKDVVKGNKGADDLNGNGGADTVSGGDGNDTVDGSGGNDVLSGDNGNDLVRGGGGKDKISGGNGHDTLQGGDGNDLMFGGNDKDSLQGGTGDDRLNGGNGDDELLGGDGDDTLRGDAGNDTLNGGRGRDFLFVEEGDNLLIGGEGNDILSAGKDNDTLQGGDGDDRLTTEFGDSVLVGGEGEDDFVFRFAAGSHEIRDFESGVDLINLGSRFIRDDLSGFDFYQNFEALQDNNYLVDSGADAVLTLRGLEITLIDIQIEDLSQSDFSF